MNTNDFIDKITHYSEENELVHTYFNVDNKAKAYDRFLKRLFWVDELDIYTTGWLGELYDYTNGVDLINYYIAPYNNYYNQKKFAYDDFCRGWITNHKNEILADFYAFMTDNTSLIGFLGQLRDTQGNHFIAYSKTKKRLSDVDVIFSSVFSLYDYIIDSLNKNESLNFEKPLAFWRERDNELDQAYQNNVIMEYKMKHLFKLESDNYRLNKKIEE